MNKLKRGLLYLSVPLVLGIGSCTINKNYIDDVYYTPPKKEVSIDGVLRYKEDPTVEEDNWNYSRNIKPKQDSTKENNSNTNINIYLDEGFDYTYRINRFRDQFFRFDLNSWDSDGDGIDNWADPWPYSFGPYLDMNENGIIDFQDIKISGFGYDFWDYELYHNYSLWHQGGYYGGGFYEWDNPYYSHWHNPWWNYHDWIDDNVGGDKKIIYGHRNSTLTDGPATRIYKENFNGDLIRKINPTTNSRTYVKPEKTNPQRVVSPQNKINSSSGERAVSTYRKTETPTRTSTYSGATRTYSPPPSRTSTTTIQRPTYNSSSSSSVTRSGSSSSSSSGATRSSSTTSSSSGVSRTIRR